MGSERFEQLFTAGVASVRTGSHGIEDSPQATGRWGPSMVLIPAADLARRLDDLTTAAAEAAGETHWLSGRLGRAHITVRALEPYALSVPPERVSRYRSALRRALHEVGPLQFEFGGLGVSTGSVVIRAEPVEQGAQALRERLGTELGEDGWLEDHVYENGRDPIWYCSILHYASPIADPAKLLAWVDESAGTSLGVHTFESVEICLWAQDGNGMSPEVVASIPAGAA